MALALALALAQGLGLGFVFEDQSGNSRFWIHSARAREFTLERGSESHARAEVKRPSSVNIMQSVLFMSLQPARAKEVMLERSFIVCISAQA
ncbi:hypothetical protein CsSME_00026034 [Camellia sinensis var. sinensis]